MKHLAMLVVFVVTFMSCTLPTNQEAGFVVPVGTVDSVVTSARSNDSVATSALSSGLGSPSATSTGIFRNRTVWGFPGPPEGYRLNILVNANAYVPEVVWESNEWQSSIGAVNRQFPVHVWVRRDTEWERVDTLWCRANRGGSIQVNTQRYNVQPTDIVGIEYTPAVMTGKDLPLGSLIDNVSTAPTTLHPWTLQTLQQWEHDCVDTRTRPVRR